MIKILRLAILTIIAAILVFPFFWMLSTSFKTAGDIFKFPPELFPVAPSFDNYAGIWKAIPMKTFFMNSIIVTVFTVLINVFVASMTGFALARLDFRGKRLLFILVMSAIIIPKEILIIPVYSLVIKAGLIDKLAGVVLPFAVEGISIFMLRQAYLYIPKEIEEAAVLDGCGTFKLWIKVMFPMTLPSVVVVALFSFMGAWGDFLWPMIVLQNPENYTLQVGLQSMLGTFVNNFRFVAAGTMLSVVPVLIVFVFFQKYFIRGIFAGTGK